MGLVRGYGRLVGSSRLVLHTCFGKEGAEAMVGVGLLAFLGEETVGLNAKTMSAEGNANRSRNDA